MTFDAEGVDERREEPRDRLENNLYVNFLWDDPINKKNTSIYKFKNLEEIINKINYKNTKTENEFKTFENFYIKNNIEPFILEENRINRRVDDFIIRHLPEIRQLPQFPEIRPERVPLPLPEVPSTRSFRSKTGFWAQADPYFKPEGKTVKGEGFEGKTMAQIHFTPEGRGKAPQKVLPDGKTVPDYEKMSDLMIKGLAGISELMEAIDSGRFAQVEVLTGTTNINMALIAQRLGLRIVDQDRTPDGKIDKTKRVFTVMGRVADVREKLKEYAENGRVERVKRRQQRLAPAAI